MTRLSSKSLYGLAALFELACHIGRESVPIKEIARAQFIPEGYLRQLLISLKRAKLIKSTRGKVGGYSLARSASEITVKEIIEHLDGPLDLPRTVLKDKTLRSYLTSCQKAIGSAFDQTLEYLVAERKRQVKNIIYHI